MFLINASNLHVGGGVQVAASFIAELAAFSDLPECLYIWASDEVDTNLKASEANLSNLVHYEVVNTYGPKILFSPVFKRLNDFDAVFTVFGPLYVSRLRGKSIIGFAQPWVIYPNNEIYGAMGFTRKWAMRLRRAVQKFFFSRADTYIVELEHVREGLRRQGVGVGKPVNVVRNCVSSIFFYEKLWKPVALPEKRADVNLGFVGRNYQHKNTQIFPEIVKQCRKNYGVEVSIFVTFTQKEWRSCSVEFRKSVLNVGPLSIAQCPAFYKSMDAVIFPSLLECFSATPLEAMIMGKPVLASDRAFNRDVCGDHAVFFDPLSAEDASTAIAEVFLDGSVNDDVLTQARRYAMNFSNPKSRAEQYLEILLGSL
ncbi:glycosyltransferase family 4 protein [Spiribacter salinus]|uniref:glycosyltransferase family 4 protein n=1 Tax=Spiribacter salinus TaxID=1335746 RepID=UPI001C9745E5|nr:glycosyltransferase family 4 protein [Spiribacter salinus]MBY5267718.1 hypothetical protein [Spiribacter salinus]